jgi:hypothetical protein
MAEFDIIPDGGGVLDFLVVSDLVVGISRVLAVEHDNWRSCADSGKLIKVAKTRSRLGQTPRFQPNALTTSISSAACYPKLKPVSRKRDLHVVSGYIYVTIQPTSRIILSPIGC